MTEDEMNAMIQEITMGVPREQSLVIRNEADAAAWDSLAAQIAEIKARGHEVEIPFGMPAVEVVKPPTEEG